MQLRIQGHTYRSFGQLHGVSHQAVQATAAGKPSKRIEDLLAAVCGLPPAALWWEHYAESGARIPVERATSRAADPSTPCGGVHVESDEAA